MSACTFDSQRRRPLVEPLEKRTLFSMPTSFASRGPGGGGAFFGPSFSPYNANEIFAASDMSGVYRSGNLGASWQIQDFRQVQAGRTSAVQFTSNSSILYVNDRTDDAGAPSKSTDGGATWQRLGAYPGDDAVGTLADPNGTTRVIAWDYTALYVSNNGGTSFALSYTYPDGATGLHVGGAFFDGNTIYLGTNGGLLVSTNGGTSFAMSAAAGLPAGKGIFSFAGAKVGSTVRLYASLIDSSDLFSGVNIESVGTSSFAGIYSIDMDAPTPAWVSRSATIPAGEFPFFVSASRGNVNTVYAAGASSAGAPIVIKSTNAGVNWANVLFTANNQNVATGWQGAGGDSGWGFGELALDFTVAPNDPNKLAFSDYGYIHLSTDGGATWRQAYLNPADQNAANTTIPKHKPYRGVGLEDTSALWLQWTSPTNMFAGYTDITGVRSTDGGSSWYFPTNNYKQNTIYQVSAAPNGTLYAASSSVHDLYQSTYLMDSKIDSGTGAVISSADGGNTWNLIHDFTDPVIYTAIDPANPNRMYASVVNRTAGGIYVTNNLNLGTGSTWTKLANPPRTEGHPYDIRILTDGSLVVTYSGRRTSTAFTNSSGVFISSDGGASWIDRTDTALTGMRYYTKEITIDPNDASQNTWYVAVRSGWGGQGNDMGGLYKTTNRGQSWTRIFSAASAESVTIASTGEMYLATQDKGLWYSTGGASPTFVQVTAYPFRQPERVFINPNNPGEIWVASFGYGLAVSQTDSTPPTVSSAALQYSATTKTINFTFSEDIIPTDISPLVLANLDNSSMAEPFAVSYSATTFTSSFTFGTIPTGRWRATLSASKVKDKAGNTMAANYTFDLIVVNTGTTLTLAPAAQTYATQALAIVGTGTLALNNNKLNVSYAGTSPLGAWNGSAYTGITGLIAGGRITATNSVGVIDSAGVVRIASVQAGDADVNGRIDGDDYFRIDTGFVAHSTGYANGDFDYNGRINADDYFLIDSHYHQSLASLFAGGAEIPRASAASLPQSSKKEDVWDEFAAR